MQRTIEQRKNEIKPILKKLTEMQLSAFEHPEIRELIKILQTYIKNGERLEFTIPFPKADVDIKGLLTENINERVWVKFTRG